jgi:hypothetical protein
MKSPIVDRIVSNNDVQSALSKLVGKNPFFIADDEEFYQAIVKICQEFEKLKRASKS